MPISTNVVMAPNPGVTGYVHDVVCQAAKGNSNQLFTCYHGDATITLPPSGYGSELATRLYHGLLVNNIGQ